MALPQLSRPLAAHLTSPTVSWSSLSSLSITATPIHEKSRSSSQSSAETFVERPSPSWPSTERISSYTFKPDHGPPTYTPSPDAHPSEPKTLAKYMFIFGFGKAFSCASKPQLTRILVFPVFWFVGAFMLRFPSTGPRFVPPSAGWMPDQTTLERHSLARRRRDTEVKWATRCMWAAVAIFCIGLVAGMSAWGAINSRRSE